MAEMIYHGTSESVARKALIEGLLPRAATGTPSNWQNVPSIPEHIYLTRLYAPYFANTAAKEGERWAIIEIDLTKLDERNLFPDEDWVEQASRDTFADIGVDELKERTAWVRKHILGFRRYWRDSLDELSNISHRGPIPTGAIRRIAFYDQRSNPPTTLSCLDPTITVLNALVAGEKYEAITKWFLGENIRPEQFMGFAYDALTGESLRKQVAATEKVLANRQGLEDLVNPNFGNL